MDDILVLFITSNLEKYFLKQDKWIEIFDLQFKFLLIIHTS